MFSIRSIRRINIKRTNQVIRFQANKNKQQYNQMRKIHSIPEPPTPPENDVLFISILLISYYIFVNNKPPSPPSLPF